MWAHPVGGVQWHVRRGQYYDGPKIQGVILVLELFPEQEHLRVKTLWQTVSLFHVTFVYLLPALWGGGLCCLGVVFVCLLLQAAMWTLF